MNAIEIRNLSKSFRGMYAVNKLNMTVPVGAIYGFIGENGSGTSTFDSFERRFVCVWAWCDQQSGIKKDSFGITEK